ncbi:hypothetical protein M5X11_13150 [Paenibacillus alginolyticus]|uniref:DUF2231 domain-containing protein n=1 Tax=Paenibacillus alginolyticus TaxID=59839 RepID=A0ABT4GIJ2_9BACL|nr:DUF2231 domain-containing protein [Paenibacillus alginolyticus]MCY9665900.1 hypothetical protein [Paenibacillus alginolyticus]MCY9695859.1 hypothetical protein [Paenibacillus alginolyticus]MEC0147812.1 hypothetical protein [Paenibacillus alginolyticus]
MDYILKNLHYIVTHVPIALLVFSFIFDLIAMIAKKREWHSAGMLCLVVGALGAIASVLTGPSPWRNPLVVPHEFYAKLTMVLSIVLAIVRVGLLIWKKKELGRNPIYLIGSLAAVILVGYTGHIGGQMVHKPVPAKTAVPAASPGAAPAASTAPAATAAPAK